MSRPTSSDRVFVVTYTPLVASPAGRRASEQCDLPPFIDGSIRREPDLQHRRPSISCLCRAGKFVPRLAVDDRVLYLTHKGRYGDEPRRHWRMTAVLRVIKVFNDHQAAASWYAAHGMSTPSNCMVRGNAPQPLNNRARFVYP